MGPADSSRRRHVILFKNRFVERIAAGTKCQTIRPTRKREIKVGDMLDLRHWSGAPYRSPQIKICTAVCADVRPISIDALLDEDELDQLARADGFDNSDAFLSFFADTHGLPFKGTLIRWGAP